MEVVKVFLFDKDNEVQYGLNWGQRDGREPNQAYLQLTPEVYRSDFFPVKKHYFLVDTDDGFSFVMNRGQKGEDGSALETPEDNSLLGKYLRKRLGVPENSRIEKSAIETYGRSDIDFVKIGMNHYKMDFSLNHSFVSSEVINQSRNRIIFGAPGTGKSHKLNEQAEDFFVEKKGASQNDEQQIINDEIQSCDKSAAALFAIGFNHSSFLANENPKALEKKFNISYDNAYAINQGIRVVDFYNRLPVYKSESIDNEKIKLEINKLKNEKFLMQAGSAAIGYKYSDFLYGRSTGDLIDDLDLSKTSSQASWIWSGIQAANYSYKREENEKKVYYERVTFHPNYSYAQFVGTYKPVQDSADENQIKYGYIPGPFMRIYVAAKQNPSQNFLLLIEEINRANVAAVFGDVFQLLDRDENGNSEYPVAASEDIKKYLAKNGIYEDELKIPSNMYIWATMNSADQGVFPMDTAFKRRWEFEYIGIDENEDKVKGYEIPISATKKVNWNDLRKAINNKLITLGINEDKLLGPFFLSKTVLDSALDKGMDFVKLFESKVLMYLFEDAAKMKAKQLFNVDEKKFIYSEVCKKFELEGLKVFKFNDEDVVEEHDISNKEDAVPTEGKLF